MPRLLLLSNSRNAGMDYLEHALDDLRAFLGPDVQRLFFVPYAGVTFSWDDYTASVASAFAPLGYTIEGAHTTDDPVAHLATADAVLVGGGNTFHLLRELYQTGLLDAIRERVQDGLPYVGWSAGSNVACPTICTTNDMPIVEPPSFAALGLFPVQINPHFTDAHPPGHQGETRSQRIEEYVTANPGQAVVGLREGSAVRVEGQQVTLLGPHPVRFFRQGQPPAEFAGTNALQGLMETGT